MEKYFERLKCLYSPHIYKTVKRSGSAQTLSEGLVEFEYEIEVCKRCGKRKPNFIPYNG